MTKDTQPPTDASSDTTPFNRGDTMSATRERPIDVSSAQDLRLTRHPRAGEDPAAWNFWIPASAEMTEPVLPWDFKIGYDTA